MTCRYFHLFAYLNSVKNFKEASFLADVLILVSRSSSLTYEQEGNRRGQTPKHLSPCASVKVGSGDSCDSYGDGFPWTWRLWPTPQGLKLGPLALTYSWGGRRCRQEVLLRRGRCFSSQLSCRANGCTTSPSSSCCFRRRLLLGAGHATCAIWLLLTKYVSLPLRMKNQELRVSGATCWTG